MPVLVGFLVGCWFMGEVWLIVAGIRRARHRDLADRLEPFAPTSVADEAERWLRQRG
jgi:hypothetical protein